MRVVNFIMRVMEWQEEKNVVELNLLHLERCMIIFLMLILITSPKVTKHNNCCLTSEHMMQFNLYASQIQLCSIVLLFEVIKELSGQ